MYTEMLDQKAADRDCGPGGKMRTIIMRTGWHLMKTCSPVGGVSMLTADG